MPQEIVYQSLSAFLPWILLLGLISILGAVFRYTIRPRLKGFLGEAVINIRIRRDLDPNFYHLIPNVTLPTPEGTTQIDHVIVSRYGIVVLEAKAYKGWIFGGEHESQWTQTIYKRKERFQNPLRQNYKHTRTLSDLTGIPHEYFKSLVVFAGEAEFKSPMPANVVHLQGFTPYIKSHTTPIIQDEQVPEVTAAIQEWAGTVSDEQKRRHVKNLRENHRLAPSEPGAPTCPFCHAGIILRTRKKDGGRFWGCLGYPACKGTRPAE